MNLADPELELIDPTPNVHHLFIHFDKQFFWTKLASRAVVRWSKRMYSCAGICSYEGRGGLCDIALSEPLLKLRPRKDLVETLLHEMIHAFLFVTCRDQDRDGHGPNFKSHMYRINKFAGLNISIYHDFHDEVKLYQTHWWRCNGPCQTRKPYFGIVRRTCNRAPGKNDCWWQDHQSKCGGTFIKIKEPTPTKKSAKSLAAKAKNNADITKYINNNNNQTNNNNDTDKNLKKPVLKDCSNVAVHNVATKSNSSSTVVVTKKGNIVFNPKASQPVITPIPFSGNGQTISGDRKRSNSVDVIDTVRNVWANKKLTSTVNSVGNSTVLNKINKPPSRLSSPITPKHKIESPTNSPPMKIKKIDDYFKNTASSILKDVYGEDFRITESDDNKLKAVNAKALVDCPVCSAKVDSSEINKHLDECLNKEVLEQLSQSNHEPEDIKPNLNLTVMKSTNTNPELVNSNIGLTKQISSPESKHKLPDFIDLRFVTTERMPIQMPKKEVADSDSFNTIVLTNKVSTVVKNIHPGSAAVLKKSVDVKVKPGCSKDLAAFDIKEVLTDDVKATPKACPCCGKEFDQPVEVHLEECLGMFDNDTTIPEEGASTSYLADTILIDDDDDDIFDETLTLNATGTKSPCPCCLKMIEAAQMNDHLDECLK